ncbi:unnamed protein product [Nippostrongylus brasiliensis]|uniref:Adipocyte plasma membrane-associated protein n=1 Tax=Nippostrongylus brasiliensis TaxID=27835 RepID=A0A0N4XEJ3_NIPBR|nr:unnamed protein product [Nippostrongylus brasiliensis]
MNAFVQVQAVRLRSKNHLAKKPSAATSGGDILDDDYDYEQFCPRRVDAFVTVHRDSFLFAGGDVYVIRKDRINSLEYIGEVFLKGPASVDAALYDKNRKIVVLIKGRTVYAFKRRPGLRFLLLNKFPVRLSPTVPFTPVGGMTWRDNRLLLLSNDGRFGIYDEFLNHSLMVANVSDYFTGLPKRVRGISSWENGEARIYTKHHVYIYRNDTNKVLGKGVRTASFLKCTL